MMQEQQELLRYFIAERLAPPVAVLAGGDISLEQQALQALALADLALAAIDARAAEAEAHVHHCAECGARWDENVDEP